MKYLLWSLVLGSFAFGAGCDDSDTRIIATLSCEREFDEETTVRYQVVDWSDGSVFASCEFADAETTASSAFFYGPTQFGAQRGGCVLTYDQDEPSGGTWTFRAMPNPEATYADPGSPMDGDIEVFEPDDCVTIPHNDGVRIDYEVRDP